MSTTTVLYVRQRDAKLMKTQLEDVRELDKRFRMIPCNSERIVHDDFVVKGVDHNVQHFGSINEEISADQCIAIPVSQSCFDQVHKYPWFSKVVGRGMQYCPFSTSMGNSNRAPVVAQNLFRNETLHYALNDVQDAIVDTLITHCLPIYNVNEKTRSEKESIDCNRKMIVKIVLALSTQACPKKLEVIGNERTLVVPRWSLYMTNSDDCKTILRKLEGANEFSELLAQFKLQSNSKVEGFMNIQSFLWERLAYNHRSLRVVRRGDIDPESGVRESGHRILWPKPSICKYGDFNQGFIPSDTGEGSPGWITVTEHKISQSFDLTRVMFSRGNVTEKKRFASLVQPGEHVLDMYAGIGYYTLPALVHGDAGHVTACEWNPHAIYALRHNLKANGVEHKATVLEGDCRVSLRKRLDSDILSDSHKYFDRVSLGLLPSSEGGWAAAIASLNHTAGGWLHIHANVPTTERQNWSHWMCQSLKLLSDRHNYSKEWHVLCTHVEKVKSFAPMIDHIVADVFVGPNDSPKNRYGFGCSGVLDTCGVFNPTSVADISPPSCALSKDGILHQDWLIK